MKDKMFKILTKFFIVVGIAYWLMLITAALTGCTTTEVNEYEDIDIRLKSLYHESKKYKPAQKYYHLDEPLGARDYWEREELLRNFNY